MQQVVVPRLCWCLAGAGMNTQIGRETLLLIQSIVGFTERINSLGILAIKRLAGHFAIKIATQGMRLQWSSLLRADKICQRKGSFFPFV